MADNIVRFDKLKCAPDASFWAKFAELKIDKFKLKDEIKIPLWASYDFKEEYPCLSIDYTSFNVELESTSHKRAIPCKGIMINQNTLEKFRDVEPQNLLNVLGKDLLDSINNGSALKEPWRLLVFFIHSFSDLKKYRFYYWAAHPTPYNLPEMHFAKQPTIPIFEEFPDDLVKNFQDGFLKLKPQSKCYFCVVSSKDFNTLEVVPLEQGVKIRDALDEEPQLEVFFAFFDPCAHPSAPGWPLRNLLCLLYFQCPAMFEKPMKFISVRGNNIRNSLIFTITTDQKRNKELLRLKLFEGNLVGWESNVRGKMGPNVIDLSDQMDPIKLSDRAINLNLKLMKWRLVPDLDLDYISKLKCLLLGAGTLGCSVARALLGWGINTITFVDNSTVSSSNTIEPSLYTFEDFKERKFKVDAAKDAVLKIHPKLNVEGVNLQIPTLGESMKENFSHESINKTVEKLKELIRSHDVVFLLLNSREASWLPTVMCTAHNKLAINIDIGLNSYTVLRHGFRNETDNSPEDELGCHFCNDVAQSTNVPTNHESLFEKKQKVNRPDLTLIAAGYAAEVMVALTQHPDKAKALASTGDDQASEKTGLLGDVPHILQGSIKVHEIQVSTTPRYSSCPACSTSVVIEYLRNENLSSLEESVKNLSINETDSMPSLVRLKPESEKSVDLNLNLRLMESLVPGLDLEYIRNLRCLLLGAGTLGCSVAKSLVGWGIRTITFVDNSAVSLSNPVRQSLYTFDDAINKKLKVDAAKNALLKQNPNLVVNGFNFQIPMPGHVVGESLLEYTKQAVIKLQELYSNHDVVFLLLDSREARWLPTVMCAAHNKVAINAALGFDSYTVLRHGTRNEISESSPQLTNINPVGKDLGCYFCNDVTQPGNSQVDRTLDQQCTVSRPGLSFIASGLAVALLAAVTQHPDKADARATLTATGNTSASESAESMGLLGAVPHSLRGSLWDYKMLKTVVQRFPSCTACSAPVISEYLRNGVDFVLNACNQPNYLENLSGLDKLLIPDLDEICYAIDSSDEDMD